MATDILAQHMSFVYNVENTGAERSDPPLPSYSELATIESLPDPFWSDGRERVSSRSEWRCRRAEIQHYEVRTKPAPPGNMKASSLMVQS